MLIDVKLAIVKGVSTTVIKVVFEVGLMTVQPWETMRTAFERSTTAIVATVVVVVEAADMP